MGRLEEAEARMRELEREIFQLRRFGRDRFVDGDVIRFTKTHDVGSGMPGKSYTYAAVKTPAGWSMTGQHRKAIYAYDELIEFVVQHPAATDVQVATAWVDVTEAADEVRGPRPYVKDGEPEYEILTADMPAGHAPVIRGERTSFVSPTFATKPEYGNVDPESLK